MTRALRVLPVVLALALGPPAGRHEAGAQPPGKVFRIGYLGGAAFDPAKARVWQAFLQGLRERGYLEGQTVVFEHRFSEGKHERFPELIADLLRLKVDLIVTSGGPAAFAAKQATSTIPIVIVGAGDPVGTGLVQSLARPGGNITGVSEMATDLSAKRLDLLKEAVPALARVAVIWNAADPAMTLRFREFERAAGTLGVTLVPVPVREGKDFDGAFATIAREHPDGLLLIAEVLTSTYRGRVLEFAAASRLPGMYEFGSFAEDGGLMAYGPKFTDIFARAAYFVDRILKGARPAELPVEQPTRFYLTINLKTATALGLTLPASILLRADEVIQ